MGAEGGFVAVTLVPEGLVVVPEPFLKVWLGQSNVCVVLSVGLFDCGLVHYIVT